MHLSLIDESVRLSRLCGRTGDKRGVKVVVIEGLTVRIVGSTKSRSSRTAQVERLRGRVPVFLLHCGVMWFPCGLREDEKQKEVLKN